MRLDRPVRVQASGKVGALVFYRHELIAAARDDEHCLATGLLRGGDPQLGGGDVGDERSRPVSGQRGGHERTVWWRRRPEREPLRRVPRARGGERCRRRRELSGTGRPRSRRRDRCGDLPEERFAARHGHAGRWRCVSALGGLGDCTLGQRSHACVAQPIRVHAVVARSGARTTIRIGEHHAVVHEREAAAEREPMNTARGRGPWASVRVRRLVATQVRPVGGLLRAVAFRVPRQDCGLEPRELGQ